MGQDPWRAIYLEVFVYFNPPTPYGEGPVDLAVLAVGEGISIHPPRVGWD